MCYARCVDWPTRMQEGFALAAAAHGDRGAALATGGLAGSALDGATQLARELAARDRDARRRWLRALLPAAPVGGIAPALRGGALSVAPALRGGALSDPRGVPARALALLATAAPRQVGRGWLAAAPLPRPGYVPDAELLVVLRKLAAREPG